MKKILSLLMMLMICLGMWAESVDFSAQSYTNGEEISMYNGDDFTVSFNKGTNNTTPKYYTSGTAVRVYGGGYFTVESTTKTITKIEIGFGSGDGSNAITTDVVTYENGTWEGSASAVTFTIGGTTGHRRIKTIDVTFGDSNPKVSTSVISPESGTYETAQTVSITCETENATIFYSFNQTDWTEYKNAIEITETTTLYAKATKEGMNDSQVASATYTFVDPTLSNAMFDFDNDYATLFGIEEFTTGEYDFEETQTISKDGIQISISPSTSNTPNRLWYNSPRLRMYGGTMTITAPEGYVISVLEINQGKWNNGNTVNLGTLTSTSWTGNASELTISIAGNTQFKSINVIYKPGQGDEPPTPQITEISTIAEIKNLEINDIFIFTDTVTVIDKESNHLYIQDETGAALIYGSIDKNYVTTNVIPAGWKGKISIYNNKVEIIPIEGFEDPVTYINNEGQEVLVIRNIVPLEIHSNISVDDAFANLYKFCVINEATFIEPDSWNNWNEKLMIRDTYGDIQAYMKTLGHEWLDPNTFDFSASYSIYGVLDIYVTNTKANTIQILPMGVEHDGTVTDNIETITTNEIKSIKYIDTMGRMSDKPFEGVNIVVKEYNNGTKRISKQIYKF